jgi:hypothetical protein
LLNKYQKSLGPAWLTGFNSPALHPFTCALVIRAEKYGPEGVHEISPDSIKGKRAENKWSELNSSNPSPNFGTQYRLEI